MKKERRNPQLAVKLPQTLQEENLLNHHQKFAAPIFNLRLAPPFLRFEIRSTIRGAIRMLVGKRIEFPAQMQWRARIDPNAPQTAGQKQNQPGINRNVRRGGHRTLRE